MGGDITESHIFACAIQVGQQLGKILFLQQNGWTVFNPFLTKASLILGLQPLIFSFLSEVAFNLCNFRFLVVETEFAVKLLQEYIKHRINLVLTDTIEFFLNVEQHTFGRHTTCFLNVSLQLKVIAGLIGKDVGTLTTIHSQFILQDV